MLNTRMENKMQKIRIAYTTSYLPISPLIQFVTWSSWSHVIILTNDNTGIEATLSTGVHEDTYENIFERAKHLHIVEYDVKDAEAIIAAARSQIGKKYDFTALFGIIIRRDLSERDKWFCSELMAYAFDKGGSPLFRKDSISRITPQDCWKVFGKDIGRMK